MWLGEAADRRRIGDRCAARARMPAMGLVGVKAVEARGGLRRVKAWLRTTEGGMRRPPSPTADRPLRTSVAAKCHC